MDALKKTIGELKLQLQSKSSEMSADKTVVVSQVANLHQQLGHAYCEFREYGAATNAFGDSLENLRKLHGKAKTHPDIAVVLLDLANAHNGDQNFKKGLRYANDAMVMLQGLYGSLSKTPELAKGLYEIGSGLFMMRDYALSIKYARQSYDMLTDLFGQDANTRELANALHLSGCSYAALFAIDQAQTNMKSALHMRRLIYGGGANHPEIADSLDQLAGTYLFLKQNDHAKEHATMALTMRKAYYGENTAHPDIAESLFHLGGIIAVSSANYVNDPEARKYAEEAKINGMTYVAANGPNCKVAQVLLDYSITLVPLAQHSDALIVAMESYTMLAEHLGKDAAHPVIADVLMHMGTIHAIITYHGGTADGSNYQTAIRCFYEALDMLFVIHGKTAVHQDIAKIHVHLGEAFQDIEDYKNSHSHYEHAKRILIQLHGSEEHKQVKTIKRRIKNVEKHMNGHRKDDTAVKKHKRKAKRHREIWDEPKSSIFPQWDSKNDDSLYDSYVANHQHGNAHSNDEGIDDAIVELKQYQKRRMDAGINYY